jgi:fused signal recognition particle receptor
MLHFIKNKLKKIYASVTSQLALIFGKKNIDEKTLKELEVLLLSSDAGVVTTKKIMTHLEERWNSGSIVQGDDLRVALQNQLLSTLDQQHYEESGPIMLLVGINGSGKTTFIGKRAHSLVREGKRVLIVAADTFRAAAANQLAHWAQVAGASFVQGAENQDPASVVFMGCKKFIDEKFDVLIIDTAGRLQTKTYLMQELEKIKKIINKHFPTAHINTLLTIDGMLGQNSFEQAKLFKSSVAITGVVLTKMDGTGKGGIVFSIVDELKIPIAYISFGEQLDQYKIFDKVEYVKQLLQ